MIPHVTMSAAGPQYDVIYDVTTAGYRWWPIGIAFAVALGTCVAILVSQKRFPTTVRGPWNRPVGYFALAFVCCMCADALWSTHREYAELSNRLRTGDFDVVEGTIEHFVPPYGKSPERFTVGEHQYSVKASYNLDPGYHTRSGIGSPIQDGVHVRIADADGVIARLEVLRADETAKDSAP